MLDAAAQLFAARPDVEAVGVDEVASLAGISKATLYRYFPSKAALIEAVAEREGVDASQWQAPDRRAQIVEAAMRLIPERGLRSVTMEQIAEAVGVSPATIYWHYASKDDLVIAVAEYCSPVPIVKTALGDGATGDLEADLRRFVTAMLSHAAGRFEVIQACLTDAWASPRVARHVMGTVALPMWNELRRYFDAQTKAGRLRKAHFIPRMLGLAGPIWTYLMARRALAGMTGVAERALAAGEGALAMDRQARKTGHAPATGFGPFAAMLAMMAASGVEDAEELRTLSPEELVATHVDTFLAGNATPGYLEELRRRGADNAAAGTAAATQTEAANGT